MSQTILNDPEKSTISANKDITNLKIKIVTHAEPARRTVSQLLKPSLVPALDLKDQKSMFELADDDSVKPENLE